MIGCVQFETEVTASLGSAGYNVDTPDADIADGHGAGILGSSLQDVAAKLVHDNASVAILGSTWEGREACIEYFGHSGTWAES